MYTASIKPNKQKALFFAKRHLPELVCDAVNLEGICYTLPEVQTLLDGVTVGGHKLCDQRITLNQAAAWKVVFELVSKDAFNLSKETACLIHREAAKEDALPWGQFRTGAVTIAGTTYTPPSPKLLDALWLKMLEKSPTIADIYNRAIFIFLEMSRNQFFFDVNKRMGRFMMNGLLLSEGYPVINVPASRQQEFNMLMLEFYTTNHPDKMTHFMRSCLDPRIVDIMSE